MDVLTKHLQVEQLQVRGDIVATCSCQPGHSFLSNLSKLSLVICHQSSNLPYGLNLILDKDGKRILEWDT